MILNSIKYNKWEVPFKVIKLAIIIINKIYTALCENGSFQKKAFASFSSIALRPCLAASIEYATYNGN